MKIIRVAFIVCEGTRKKKAFAERNLRAWQAVRGQGLARGVS